MPTFMLASKVFSTKTAAREYVKALLNNAAEDVPFQGDDRILLMSLLCSYPDYKNEDVYRNASDIIVSRHPDYHNRCFFAQTSEGDSLPWSYRKAFAPPSWHRRITAACRSIIEPQIREYREQATRPDGLIKCELTNELCDSGDIDIDHCFDHVDAWHSSLVSRWMTEAAVPAKPPILNHKRSRKIEFADAALNESWFRFHKENAKLRAIKRELNRGHGSPTTSDVSDASDDEKDSIKSVRSTPTTLHTPTPTPSPAMPPTERSEIDLSKLTLNDDKKRIVSDPTDAPKDDFILNACCRDCGDELTPTYKSAGMTLCATCFSRWVESL